MAQKKKLSTKTIINHIREEYPDCLFMDGYDDCIIGICHRFGQEPIIAYNRQKVIKKLEKHMTEEEAIEFHEFNQVGAYMGDKTPCFIELI